MSNYQVTVCDAHDLKVRVISNPKTLKDAMRKAKIAEKVAMGSEHKRAVIVLDPEKEAVYISVVDNDGVITVVHTVAKALEVVTGTYKDHVVNGTCEGDCEQ